MEDRIIINKRELDDVTRYFKEEENRKQVFSKLNDGSI